MPDMKNLTPHIIPIRRPTLPDSVVYRRARERLTRLKQLLDQHQIRAVFIFAPLLGSEHYNEVAQRAAIDAGIIAIKPFDGTSFTESDYSEDRFHMNETGAIHYTARLTPFLRGALSDDGPELAGKPAR